VDEKKEQVKSFFREFEFEYVKKEWLNRLIELGIDDEEARVWAIEIGHVVDEYSSTLQLLCDVVTETKAEKIPEAVYDWAVGITEVTVPEISDPMKYLEEQLEKYIPPDQDEDEK